ncbi:hypothetical protein [Micromonospora rubida]|uniref:hypothetical protein n=1 Tax=Micromonospora rubida TaxID=2697657 RepID=UPI001378487B|nr:hypothetical protein [Micromonospora rubida]NBE80318.1 hypothetical protein [Micromonospora rubida]
MSRAELATYVHVADEHGVGHVFGPGDLVPAWAVGKIVNPKAWKGGTVPSDVESPADERARLLARLAELDEAGDPDGDGSDGEDNPPPKSGPGSGAPRWREYAARHEVEVPADASREAVIAALDEAKVPTE